MAFKIVVTYRYSKEDSFNGGTPQWWGANRGSDVPLLEEHACRSRISANAY